MNRFLFCLRVVSTKRKSRAVPRRLPLRAACIVSWLAVRVLWINDSNRSRLQITPKPRKMYWEDDDSSSVNALIGRRWSRRPCVPCVPCSMKKLNGVGVMGLAIGERVCLSNRVNLKGLIMTSKDSTASSFSLRRLIKNSYRHYLNYWNWRLSHRQRTDPGATASIFDTIQVAAAKNPNESLLLQCTMNWLNDDTGRPKMSNHPQPMTLL